MYPIEKRTDILDSDEGAGTIEVTELIDISGDVNAFGKAVADRKCDCLSCKSVETFPHLSQIADDPYLFREVTEGH